MTGAPGSAVDLAARQIAFNGDGDRQVTRAVPLETPVSIEVCGIAYAVMMATPADLEDFARGFALGEGLIDHVGEIDAIDVTAVEGGIALRIALPPERADRAMERARRRVSESSCGLCGIDNIAEVLRPLPRVTARIATDRHAIARSLAALRDHQPLGRATGAVHAAAYCAPDGAILLTREDVGRHNALDKLVGALAAAGTDPATGYFLLSARCSYELVEKTVRAGCPMLVTISAPTSLAVERARDARLTLIALARADSALLLCDEQAMLA